jgi:RNA polymerase sigma-70 factor (ECF subfamily)
MLFFTLEIDSKPPKKTKKQKTKSSKYNIKSLVNKKFKVDDKNKVKNLFEANKTLKEKDIKKLFVMYYDELLRFCDSRIHSKADSEDILQEVFITLLEKHKSLSKKYIRKWLYKTTYNYILNLQKKKKNRDKILIEVKYSEINEEKYYYTLEYPENIIKIIKNNLSKKDFDFFIKYILKSTDKPELKQSDDNVPKSIRIKRCRIRKKIYQILVDNGIIN